MGVLAAGDWPQLILAPRGDGTTRRRGSDVFRLGAAILVILSFWLILQAGPHFESAVIGFVSPPPRGVKWLVTTVWLLSSFGLIVVIVLVALLARRKAMARDVVLAGLAAWGLAYLLDRSLGPNPGKLSSPALAHVDLRYPEVRVAVAVAVATAAAPYLARGLERFVQIVIALAALATIVHGSGLLTAVLASIALGWGVTAGLHVIFGTPLGLLSSDDVARFLGDMSIDSHGVEPDGSQEWGVARYRGLDETGPIAISVYGRDDRDAQLLAKSFRSIFYRDSGPTITLTRLQQVEHEAYLTLLAKNHGTNAAAVLGAARAGPSKDAFLVTRPPPGTRLADLIDVQPVPVPLAENGPPRHATADVADAALDATLTQVLALRRARIAHGAITTETILIDRDAVGLVEFRLASSDASDKQLDRDMACALGALGIAVGADRTVSAARRALPPEVLASALPFLQRAAFPRSLARQFRGNKALLAELRDLGAQAAGVEVPKLAEARRISWVTLALVAGSLVGGWALIGVLIDVGKSFDTIVGADWGWVLAVFLTSIAVYPSLSMEVLGAVIEPLPFGRTLALEIADTFVGLAGGTMAVLATRVRFFQQQGYPPTLAVSSGVLISTVSWTVKGGLFLAALPFGLSNLDLDEPGAGSARTVWLIIVVVVLVALALGVVLAVPRLRKLAKDKLRPKLSDVWNHLRSLATRPSKLFQIFGGALGAQLLVVLALGASLQAFGDHLSIATLLVVITLASMLGGVSPVPGGVGVVEAGLILGLTSAGIPEANAVAAVFLQRLFTSYLPPIAGWVALVSMRRRELL